MLPQKVSQCGQYIFIGELERSARQLRLCPGTAACSQGSGRGLPSHRVLLGQRGVASVPLSASGVPWAPRHALPPRHWVLG